MPIKPENKKLYPPDWKEIRERILKRAGNKCEHCGVENHQIGIRDENGDFWTFDQIGCLDPNGNPIYIPEESHEIKIVLTIAHLDHDPTNNDEDNNLRALCQKCHNTHDAANRQETRRKTRYNQKIKEGGQIPLFSNG